MRDPMTFRWLDEFSSSNMRSDCVALYTARALTLESAQCSSTSAYSVMAWSTTNSRCRPRRSPGRGVTVRRAGAGDEVAFRACTYSEMLRTWEDSEDEPVKSHADAVAAEFDVSRDFRASKKD